MAKFNQPSAGTKTVNLAHGQAYAQTPELELLSILLTSFVSDQFYRTASDTLDRLKELIRLCDKKFVAQAAVYARHEFGMRSITHCVAAELAKYISGESWAKNFYTAIIRRPDDITEIVSYYDAYCAEKSDKSKRGKKHLTAAMKAGLAKSFDKIGRAGLAKYRGEGKGFKMVDIVNVVHPKPTEKNADAIKALVEGTLKLEGDESTWESEMSAAGQLEGTAQEKEAFKQDVWVKMIREKKIKYFALLRNLRNIMLHAPEVLDEALEMLVDQSLIKNSLVFPFRYLTAYDEIEKLGSGKDTRKVMIALNSAVDIAVKNVPVFEGNTLVVLDTSSSMTQNIRSKGAALPPAKIGSLFAAVLVKASNADLMTFDHDARYNNINPMDSTVSIAKSMAFTGGATNFHSIFIRAKSKYDRVIILSDMQGWAGDYMSPVADFNAYKARTGATPFVYSFDLQGYGSMQFPEQNVFCIAGYSDKALGLMKLLEQDRQVLINTIKKVEF